VQRDALVDDRAMEPEPLIYREEVTAILGVFADLDVHVRRILDLLESEFDGEEGLEENDT
jgi:hypothetical protein